MWAMGGKKKKKTTSRMCRFKKGWNFGLFVHAGKGGKKRGTSGLGGKVSRTDAPDKRTHIRSSPKSEFYYSSSCGTWEEKTDGKGFFGPVEQGERPHKQR